MGLAVYHTEKGTVSSGGIGNHIDRVVGEEHTYQHADPTRKHLNQDFKITSHCSKPLHEAIKERIEEGYKGKTAIRKDAVKYQTHVLTGSHEEMKKVFSNSETEKAWIKANLEFIKAEYGKENIVRFVLHRDEKTPHLHVVTVPITKDGRLSAKEVMGNPLAFKQRQDRYADAMKQFGLFRGVEGTGIKHENAKEYYARMKESLEYANKDEIKASKGFLGVYKEESVLELERAVKSLKTDLKSKKLELKKKTEELKSFESRELTSLNNYKRKYNHLLEEREKTFEKMEKILIDPNYREQMFAERFEKALSNVFDDVQRNARKSKMNIIDKTNFIDESIRKHMKEVNPRMNVWETMDKYSGGKRNEIEKALSDKYDEALKFGQKQGYSRGGR